FENVDDVGMAKLCGCAGLAEESLAIGVAFQYARMRKLQGDEAIELSVARFPNRPEAADPHALQKLKFTELTHAACRAAQSSVPYVKVAATDGAEHLVGAVVGKVDRIVAIGAADSGVYHGRDRRRGNCGNISSGRRVVGRLWQFRRGRKRIVLGGRRGHGPAHESRSVEGF